MTNLQRHLGRWQLTIDAVEAVDGEILLVGRLRVIAVGDIDDIAVDVLLDDKPRSATKAHTLALANGVEPVATVTADDTAGLQFHDITWQLT